MQGSSWDPEGTGRVRRGLETGCCEPSLAHSVPRTVTGGRKSPAPNLEKLNSSAHKTRNPDIWGAPNKMALFLPAHPTGRFTCQYQTQSIQSALYGFTRKYEHTARILSHLKKASNKGHGDRNKWGRRRKSQTMQGAEKLSKKMKQKLLSGRQDIAILNPEHLQSIIKNT